MFFRLIIPNKFFSGNRNIFIAIFGQALKSQIHVLYNLGKKKNVAYLPFPFVFQECNTGSIILGLVGTGWLNELGSWITWQLISLSPIRRGFAPGFVNYKKGALDSQPQVIKFTSCLPMVSGSFRVLRLIPPLKLVVMI